MEETKYTTAQANSKLDKNGKFTEDLVSCRQGNLALFWLNLIMLTILTFHQNN